MIVIEERENDRAAGASPSRSPAARRATVLLTDHPWPDLDIEKEVIEGAGFVLVAGPVDAPSAPEIERHIADTDPVAILTCWGHVSAAAIASPSDLRMVARMGVGLDNIAVSDATARGAWVTNVPDYCVSEVSDHAIALILAHFRGVARLDAATKARGWQPAGQGLERLSDLTIGIIGYGRIGRETGRKLRAFGCRVLASDPSYTRADAHAEVADVAAIQDIADVIVLHVPLLPATTRMVDRAFLAGCRRRPLVVNVSRGGLIDNDALIEALDTGLLRGAALDVIDGEPAPPREVYARGDVIATPHIAFASTASMIELRRRACEEVVRVLSGVPPLNPCNTPIVSVPMPGGVASDIRLVQGEQGLEVVKRAIAKLKVSSDWFSDPRRSSTEVAAIRAFAGLIGSSVVPEILWVRPSENMFAMRLVDPRLRNWKRDLLDGRMDLSTARRAGELLGQAHLRSAHREDLEREFADTSFFHQLRIEPFFDMVAARVPRLSAVTREVVAGMANRRAALVHGDYSPKNILADGEDVVILDFEVAHWGDPRFDVAFLASHLLLKAYRRGAHRPTFLDLVRVFLGAYRANGPDVDDINLVQITGCLMLARFEGTSPVDYAADVDEAAVRALAEAMIAHAQGSLRAYLSTALEAH